MSSGSGVVGVQRRGAIGHRLDGRRAALGAALLACALSLFGSAGAAAAEPLGLTDCRELEGTRQCSGLVPSWDGVPLDTTVTMPAGADRDLPLLVELNGFGNSKWEYLNPAETAYTDNAYAWARDGYAVLTATARGQWGSCGTPEARAAEPLACAEGYIHLADTRYEVRDAQELIGRLVDDGVADPAAIGVTGDSYGGGQSLALAALRDRVMLPDGSLRKWRSPAGTALRIAAAAPIIPWVDLAYVAAPNGRVLNDAITPYSVASRPIGVEKASVVNAIFAASEFAVGPGQPLGEPFVPGRPMGYLAPIGTDPGADVAGWVARTNLGEPYDDPGARAIVDELSDHHSAYGIDPGRRPPPLLLGSGFTDDLFPVDEVVRYANRTLARYPKAELKLLLGDFGHQRASNEPRERARMLRLLHRFFDSHLRGRGSSPRSGVTAFVQRCPRERRSGGPFGARFFSRLARGEIRLDTHQAQTVESTGGDTATAVAIDPVSGMGDGCVVTEAKRAPGTAVYDLDPVARRYTLIGSATVVARIDLEGVADGNGQIAARLWDVAPDGSQRLVSRGLMRPLQGRNVFQLHPGAWSFPRGHVPRLELAGRDVPYARPSNGVYSLRVNRLRLRLPIRRRPDCETVLVPRRPILIAGTRPAPGSRTGSERRALGSGC